MLGFPVETLFKNLLHDFHSKRDKCSAYLLKHNYIHQYFYDMSLNTGDILCFMNVVTNRDI